MISDPFSSGLAVPGARIEYTITLDNTLGAVAATGILISDTIDTDVTFVANAYNGNTAGVSFDSGASFCLADAGDANNDGCTFDGTTLTIGGPSGPSIDAGIGASRTVSFVVEIPTT